MFKGHRIIVIGDAHDAPNVSQDRFKWIGKYINKSQPDYIIQIGDWASMDSLSFFQKNSSQAGKLKDAYMVDINSLRSSIDILDKYYLFVASFLSATVLPGSSEVVFITMLLHETASNWMTLWVATVGNTLGGITTFFLGRFLPTRRLPSARLLSNVQRWGGLSLFWGKGLLLLLSGSGSLPVLPTLIPAMEESGERARL